MLHLCRTLLLTDLIWIFHYLYAQVFTLVLVITKKSHLNLRYFCIIQLLFVQVISIKFIITLQIAQNEFHKKFFKINKFFVFETYYVKPSMLTLILLKPSVKILLLPLKQKLDLLTIKKICVKMQKIRSWKTKFVACFTFPPKRCRNSFVSTYFSV